MCLAFLQLTPYSDIQREREEEIYLLCLPVLSLAPDFLTSLLFFSLAYSLVNSTNLQREDNCLEKTSRHENRQRKRRSMYGFSRHSYRHSPRLPPLTPNPLVPFSTHRLSPQLTIFFFLLSLGNLLLAHLHSDFVFLLTCVGRDRPLRES